MTSDNTEFQSYSLNASNILKIPAYLLRGIKYHNAGRFHLAKPLLSTIVVTNMCNSKCIMCSCWNIKKHENELSPDEINQVYRNPLFSSLERIILSGGEPTLRDDLTEIARAVLESCPNIQELSLCTNGLGTELVLRKVKELVTLTEMKGVGKFSVLLSLDGYGYVHDHIRGVPGAFKSVLETIEGLKQLMRKVPIYIYATCVVQPLNINNLVELAKFGEDTGIPIGFAPVIVSSFFDSNGEDSALRFNDKQINELNNLFENELKPYLKPSNAPFWREYFNIVCGGKRRIPCFQLYHYVGLDSDGTMRMCASDSSLVYGNVRENSPDMIWYSESAARLRQEVKQQLCSTCTISCDPAFSLSHEVFYYAWYVLKEKSEKLFKQRRPPRP